MNENPVQRLGATGATEVSYLLPFACKLWYYVYTIGNNIFFWQVKRHAFFKDINWDTLAMQKVIILILLFELDMFVPYLLISHAGIHPNFYRLCSYHRLNLMIQVIL
jgi:hypothetical protein